MSWAEVLKRTARGFGQHNLYDLAAALTYYSVLSIFPGLVVLTAALGLLGPRSTQPLVDSINQLAPGQSRDLLIGTIDDLQRSSGLAGPLAVVGVLAALWSASGYVGAFMRASNTIHGATESRPVLKRYGLRLALTVVAVLVLALCSAGAVASGALAERLGALLGFGETAVLVWDTAKWPVIAALVGLVLALLYRLSPDSARGPWFGPGGLLAVLLWALASAGFGLYVANFGSYNKTYGALAGVIVFLVWLWISNLVVLLGAELDAQVAAEREDQHPSGTGRQEIMSSDIGQARPQDQSVAQLVHDASEQLSRLVREEMRLAAVELRNKGKRAGAGAGLFGGAGVLALYGVAVLIAAGVLGLALVVQPWLAALIVGALLLIAAGIAALIGKSQIQAAVPPVPEEAVDGVKKDVEAVKEGLHR
ncbi:YhjD/YihY/BrkB family envelope integrity protein [Kutzneria albida]|uniref:Uncharacterized protein n=1 Tax=Kutzneria albida DSM 43870 TaxID=1449976 RepID=W5WA97_9PSEU|nr:hypothetical protein KALB_4706 [Kutzneria albida DSM 43870]